MTWTYYCRTDDHCLRWSSLVSQTYKQYFSIQNFVPLSLWSLQELPLWPTLWSSQLRRVETSFVSFPMVGDPQCRSPTVQIARARKWSSFFPLWLVEHSHTFGNCHISSRNLLCLAASWARNSLPSWSSWQGTLTPCDLRKLPHVPPLGHIWSLPFLYILSRVGRSPFCKARHLALWTRQLAFGSSWLLLDLVVIIHLWGTTKLDSSILSRCAQGKFKAL